MVSQIDQIILHSFTNENIAVFSIQGHLWNDKLKVTINLIGVYVDRKKILFVVGCSHINYLIFDMLQCLHMARTYTHTHTYKWQAKLSSEFSLILVQQYRTFAHAHTANLLTAAVVEIVAEKK